MTQISSLEKAVRFSNMSGEELNGIPDVCKTKLIELCESDNAFISIMESNKNIAKPKAALVKEAQELSKSEDNTIAEFGRNALAFFAKPLEFASSILTAISAITLVGGVILATCITLILGILAFLVLVLPIGVINTLLAKQTMVLRKAANKNRDDKNVKAVMSAVRELEKLPKDKKTDIREFEKKYAKAVAMESIFSNPALLFTFESSINIEEIESYINVMSGAKTRINLSSEDSIKVALENDEVFQRYCNLTSFDVGKQPISLCESSLLENAQEGQIKYDSVDDTIFLNPNTLLEGMVYIVTDTLDNYAMGKFFNAYKNTIVYEFTNEEYKDVPLIKLTKCIENYISERCRDSAHLMDNLDVLMESLDIIADTSYDEVREDATVASTTPNGFNPNPFNVYYLTPFSVASRTVGGVVSDIEKAETDDEITEAFTELARIGRIINESYEVTESGDLSIVEEDAAKAARAAQDKAEHGFSKIAAKDRVDNVKTAAKRTIDPMEKFIQQQYDKIKEADKNERRNVIIKGGAVPKVMRWIKRSIPIIAGGVIGQVIPAAAVISGIAFIGFIATDKYLDRRERTRILQELEDEIQLCNEKIDDSRGDDNKQNKYELMRIRNELKRTQDKIRFGLKY